MLSKKAFSSIRNSQEALNILGITNYPKSVRYEISQSTLTTEIDTFISDLYKLMNRKLETIKTVEITNEADRELLSQLLIWECVGFIKDSYKIKIRIGSKKAISDNISKGFADFCIYQETPDLIDRVLVVFEVKQELFDKGVGQLLMELRAVHHTTKVESFGCITNFKIWEFFSYREENEKSIVKRFNSIVFDNTDVLDHEPFKSLVLLVIDIVLNHKNLI